MWAYFYGYTTFHPWFIEALTHVEIVSHFRKIVENGLGKWRKKGVFYPSDGKKIKWDFMRNTLGIS